MKQQVHMADLLCYIVNVEMCTSTSLVQCDRQTHLTTYRVKRRISVIVNSGIISFLSRSDLQKACVIVLFIFLLVIFIYVVLKVIKLYLICELLQLLYFRKLVILISSGHTQSVLSASLLNSTQTQLNFQFSNSNIKNLFQ